MIRLTHLTLFFVSIIFLTITAQAIPQAFVSVSGINANTCERSAPCRTFAGALAKTDPKGGLTAETLWKNAPTTLTQ
jgi:hypothetical protein